MNYSSLTERFLYNSRELSAVITDFELFLNFDQGRNFGSKSGGDGNMRGRRPRTEARSAEGGGVWGGGLPPPQGGLGVEPPEIFFKST